MDDTSIIGTTDRGLEYVDEHGERQFIDFSICHQNYLRLWNDPDHLRKIKEMNHMDNEQLERFLKKIRQRKEIGKRNPLTPPWADGPYIEFYTEPLTRFRFTDRQKYASVLSVIREAGWQTFDQG